MKCPGLDAGDAGFVGDVGESAVAVVVIENVAAELGDEEIGKAVVVVIAPDAAEAVAGAGDAGLFGDIGESAVAVVAIEGVADGNAAIVADRGHSRSRCPASRLCQSRRRRRRGQILRG